MIVPPESAALGPRALAAGAPAVLVRPFGIRDLVGALVSAADEGSTNDPRPRG